MFLTLQQRSRCRAAFVAAAMASLPLTGCSSGDAADRSSGGADTKRVSAAGISFEVPEGWEELDAGDVAEGMGEDSDLGDIAEQMGVTPDQFQQMMGNADLLLVSDEGAQQGFLENVNVVHFPGRMPNDEQLKLGFLQFGADVQHVSHERTNFGDATLVVYELELSGRQVMGEAIVVEAEDSAVSVTVSAADRDTTEDIADGIVDSLAEAS